MKKGLLLICVASIGLIGCQQEQLSDDKGMRDAMEGTQKVTADQLPDNVPQWVRDQVKAGEQRQAGQGAGAAPPPAPADK